MGKFIAASLFIATFAATASRAEDANEAKRRQAAAADTCYNAKMALESHLLGLPASCKATRECAAQYLHADSCAPAYLLNKSYVPERDAELRLLQTRARRACAAEWSGRPACAPTPVTPVCHEGRCIPADWLPPKIPAEATRGRFPHATISEGCAPHDAASWLLTFRPKKAACGDDAVYPRIAMNWWGGRPELPLTRPFRVKSGEAAGWTVSFCAAARACRQPKEVELVFTELDQSGGKGKVRLVLDDGRVVETPFTVEFCKDRPMPCG